MRWDGTRIITTSHDTFHNVTLIIVTFNLEIVQNYTKSDWTLQKILTRFAKIYNLFENDWKLTENVL